MGSGAGIRIWRGNGGRGMVGVSKQSAAATAHLHAAAVHSGSGNGALLLRSEMAAAGFIAGQSEPGRTAACDCGFQPGGNAWRPGDYRDSGDWHQGIGKLQLRDCDCEGGHRGSLPDRRGHFPGGTSVARVAKLASVHPASGRARQLRLDGNCDGCFVDLLRLYRLRCGVDRGAGGQESEARYADRNSWDRWWCARFSTSWFRRC